MNDLYDVLTKSHNASAFFNDVEIINKYIAQVFFQTKILTQRKYNGRGDAVAIYHIHNKEWSKNPMIQKYKNKPYKSSSVVI